MKEFHCPYPGLRPFRREESYLFFGREEQNDQLLKKLGDTRFISVVGLSGCGKSSLVRAGMIPALECGFLASAGPFWKTVTMRPGTQPLTELARALLNASLVEYEHLSFVQDPVRPEEMFLPFVHASLSRGPLGLVELLRENPLPERTNLLLLVDQFEEIFRYDREGGRDEIVAFVNLLLESVTQDDLPIYVVTTMRSEFIGNCALFYNLPETMNQGQFLTSRLTRSQQRDAIVGPARVFHSSIEPRLVNKLLNEMSAAPEQFDQLPLLQHCLMRMWQHSGGQNGGQMTSSDYEAVGGVQHALSRHTDEAYSELEPKQQQLVESMFRSLTERNPEGQDVRRPLPLKALSEEIGASEAELTEMIEVFRRSERNFLTISGKKSGAESVVDISHESLIRQWGKLKDWVGKEAESAEVYLNLVKRARNWQDKKGELLSGLDLDTPLQWKQQEKPVPEWAKRYDPDFALSMNYLNASEERRQRKLRKSVFGKQLLAPFALMLCLLLAWWTSFFDVFFLDTRIQGLTIGIGDELAAKGILPRKEFHEDIVMVSVGKNTLEQPDFDQKARKYYANLIETLSQAGAKVLVLMMSFSPRASEYDSELIQAIEKATERGTSVIAGFQKLQGAQPVVLEGLKHVVSAFGTGCVNTELSYARSIPFAIVKEPAGDTSPFTLPSLALEAFLKYREQDNYLLDMKQRQILTWTFQQTLPSYALDFSELGKRTSSGCPAIQGKDRFANLFLQFSPLKATLRDPSRHFVYEEVVEGIYNAKQLSDKIVLIGEEDELFSIRVSRGIGHEERYGFEIYADALNMLLNNEANFHDLSTQGQLFIMLLLSLLGSTIRYWLPSRKIWRRALFFFVLLCYAAIAVYLSDQYHIFLDSVYHIAAYWISYWIAGKWFF